jgi:hypothetical protein
MSKPTWWNALGCSHVGFFCGLFFSNRKPATPMKARTKAILCIIIGLGFTAPNGAYGQVSSINSDILHTREFNDVPGAGLIVVNNYPSLISFTEQGVSAPSGFANRDSWRFSNDGGASNYQFQNNDFFNVSMNVTLTGSPISPRKEAGFLLDTVGGQGAFIVNTDAHEVVAFGGPLPFYAFPHTYNSGDSITLGMTYFLDSSGKRAIIYSANGVESPIEEFTNLEQGIIDNSTLGGYLQIVNDSANPDNSGTAVFGSINITAAPEPNSVVLAALGFIGLAAG